MKIDKTEICPCCSNEYVMDMSPDTYFYDCCEDCSFWLEKLYLPEEYSNRMVIVEGVHYLLSNSSIKGFAGAKFKIKFFSGRLIQTNNLWRQGKIPEHFRSSLPDNAVFVEQKKPVPVYEYDEIPF